MIEDNNGGRVLQTKLNDKVFHPYLSEYLRKNLKVNVAVESWANASDEVVKYLRVSIGLGDQEITSATVELEELK